jgi:hypothetical protein
MGLKVALEDRERLKQVSSRFVRPNETAVHPRVPRLATISADLRKELMAAARAELERKADRRRGRNGRRAVVKAAPMQQGAT